MQTDKQKTVQDVNVCNKNKITYKIVFFFFLVGIKCCDHHWFGGVVGNARIDTCGTIFKKAVQLLAYVKDRTKELSLPLLLIVFLYLFFIKCVFYRNS